MEQGPAGFVHQLDSLYANQAILLAGRYPEDVLLDARSLIVPRYRYVTHAMALDVLGEHVKAADPRAIQWNLEGAVARSCNGWGIAPPELLKFLDACVAGYSLLAELPMGPDYFSTFGDFGEYYSHEHALGLLQYAEGLLRIKVRR